MSLILFFFIVSIESGDIGAVFIFTLTSLAIDLLSLLDTNAFQCTNSKFKLQSCDAEIYLIFFDAHTHTY